MRPYTELMKSHASDLGVHQSEIRRDTNYCWERHIQGHFHSIFSVPRPVSGSLGQRWGTGWAGGEREAEDELAGTSWFLGTETQSKWINKGG